MDEGGLAGARDYRAAVLEHPVVGEDDVQHALGAPRREGRKVLDRTAHDVVAERDLALEAAGVAQRDRPARRDVGLDFADVVQERAGDGQVAVDPRERRGHRAHSLRDRQAVLQQAVPVGLVVVLGGGGVTPNLPQRRVLAEQRVQQAAEIAVLDRVDQLAKVRDHPVERHRGPGLGRPRRVAPHGDHPGHGPARR